jgi:hypothetical protein
VALAGALLLIFTIFIRPQEFVPGLESIGLLNIATGLALLGIVIELATGKIKTAWSPQLPYPAGRSWPRRSRSAWSRCST